MGKTGKYALSVACQIATQTQKNKQLQSKSLYKHYQNGIKLDDTPDLFVKSRNSMANVYRKSIVEEIADRILANVTKEKK